MQGSPFDYLNLSLLSPGTIAGADKSLDTPHANARSFLQGGLGVSTSHLAKESGEDKFFGMNSRVF